MATVEKTNALEATDYNISFTIEEAARQTNQAPWMIARGISRLIALGLLEVADGSPKEALASLRCNYGEAVNGQ
jgi:hypothetical protein